MLFTARRTRLVTAFSLALCTAAPIAVYAQAGYQFDLPAQSLADSLRAVGSDASIDIAFEPATVQGRSAPALKGRYSVREAVDRLLAGSGLKLRTTPGGSFLIESGGASTSPPPAPLKSTTYNFHLPAQNLAVTLKAIERSTGQLINSGDELVTSKRATAIIGHMTPLQAVQQALTGTGFRVDTSATGGMTIRAANDLATAGDVENMDQVTVTAQVEGLAAMRVPTELREIPQSVSIISQDTLQQQNAFQLSDAFNWATGITSEQTSTGQSQFFSRGFQIGEIHVDGGAPMNLGLNGASVDDLSEYDHVEVLRGADGLFGGSGTPGGTVNLVRKQPSAQDEASITATIGSWDFYRVMLDATGALDSSGSLRGRVVATNTDQNFFYDTAHEEKHKLYGILAYDLAPGTTVTVGGSVEQSSSRGSYSGLPRFYDGGDPHLPRSTSLMFPWNHDSSHSTEAFAQLDQAFNENWKLKVGATMMKESISNLDGSSSSAAINPATDLIDGAPSATGISASVVHMTMDATLTGSFDWNGRKQEVLVGMDYARQQTSESLSNQSIQGPPLNPWLFDGAAYPPPSTISFTSPAILDNLTIYSKAVGGFAAVRLRPWDGVSVILGARDNYERLESGLSGIYSFGPTLNIPLPATQTNTVSSGVVTPYAGVVYDLNKHYSLYASYADIYQPAQGQVTASGHPIAPAQGVNAEAGIKGAWNNGLLNGSFALFHIKQNNQLVQDPSHPSLGNPACCYLAGTNTSSGAEAEFSGALTPRWQVSAGYTFNVNRMDTNLPAGLPGPNGATGSPLASYAPKHMLKLWTNYQLPGSWSRWSVGGGIRAQTSTFTEGPACPVLTLFGTCTVPLQHIKIEQGFYTVATLRADYQISSHWSASLNIDNLFDRSYYQTIGETITTGTWYGQPRSVMLTIRGSL